MTTIQPRTAKATAARKAKREAAKQGISRTAINKLEQTQTPQKYTVPVLAPNVVPKNVTPAIAMDSAAFEYANSGIYNGYGFQGYPYLAGLATRSEYRAMAGALATEITREFIEFHSNSDDTESKEKIGKIEAEFKRIGVQSAIAKAAELDALFGRAQIFISIRGHERDKPLILSNKTIALGSLERISVVEPQWTTPMTYSASDPTAIDFYKPSAWFMLGDNVHASRLLTIITRQVPDLLKPAFNFGGISLSQLAEPYVDNWLRTRQSVSDMIAIYSITMLKTDMAQVLQGGDNGEALLKRAELFVAGRANKGLAIIDKESEDIAQVNSPLSGLHELQSQAQEQMCSVSHIPSVILTGISPSGLNASNEGEIKTFYNWINALQEAYYREPIETLLKVVQLSLFGEIDSAIGFTFKHLDRMNDSEKSTIQVNRINAACNLIDHGVISAEEERERLARDSDSGYEGLDLTVMPDIDDMGDSFEDNQNDQTKRG